jgi:hypothetical protein
MKSLKINVTTFYPTDSNDLFDIQNYGRGSTYLTIDNNIQK